MPAGGFPEVPGASIGAARSGHPCPGFGSISDPRKSNLPANYRRVRKCDRAAHARKNKRSFPRLDRLRATRHGWRLKCGIDEYLKWFDAEPRGPRRICGLHAGGAIAARRNDRGEIRFPLPLALETSLKLPSCHVFRKRSILESNRQSQRHQNFSPAFRMDFPRITTGLFRVRRWPPTRLFRSEITTRWRKALPSWCSTLGLEDLEESSSRRENYARDF